MQESRSACSYSNALFLGELNRAPLYIVSIRYKKSYKNLQKLKGANGVPRRLAPVISVERTVIDGFGDVVRFDIFAFVEIGDRP